MSNLVFHDGETGAQLDGGLAAQGEPPAGPKKVRVAAPPIMPLTDCFGLLSPEQIARINDGQPPPPYYQGSIVLTDTDEEVDPVETDLDSYKQFGCGDLKSLDLYDLANRRLIYPHQYHEDLHPLISSVSKARCTLGQRLPAKVVDKIMLVLMNSVFAARGQTDGDIICCTTSVRYNSHGNPFACKNRCKRNAHCPRCALEEAARLSTIVQKHMDDGMHLYLVTLGGDWRWKTAELTRDFRPAMAVQLAANDIRGWKPVIAPLYGGVARHEFAFPVIGDAVTIYPHTHWLVLSRSPALHQDAEYKAAISHAYAVRLAKRWKALPESLRRQSRFRLDVMDPDINIRPVNPDTITRTLRYILKPMNVLLDKHYGAAMAMAQAMLPVEELMEYRRSLNESAHEALALIHLQATEGKRLNQVTVFGELYATPVSAAELARVRMAAREEPQLDDFEDDDHPGPAPEAPDDDIPF